jgi:hypothetical protein
VRRVSGTHKLRDELVYALNERFAGKTVNVKSINYGD